MRNVCSSQQNLIFPYYFPVVEAEVLNVAAMTVEVKEPYQKEATVQLEALDTLPLEVEKPAKKRKATQVSSSKIHYSNVSVLVNDLV